MKVLIGPYINHWTTQDAERAWYRFRYDKYDWEVEIKDRDWLDNTVENILGVWRACVCRPVNWIQNKRSRKIKVKIDYWDSWSADHTLALIILPLLKQLQKDKHGAPHTDDADVPEHLRSTSAPPKENDYDTDDNWFLRWDWILAEMIWAFEQDLDDDGDSQFYSGESDYWWQPLNAAHEKVGEPYSYSMTDRKNMMNEKDESVVSYEMIDGPNHTLTHDSEGHRAYRDRIQNGHRLFGVYYSGLWD